MILNTNIRILDKRILITNTTDLDWPTLGVGLHQRYWQFWLVQVDISRDSRIFLELRLEVASRGFLDHSRRKTQPGDVPAACFQ